MAGSIRFEAYSVIRIRWFQFDSRSEIGVNFLIRELCAGVELDYQLLSM